MNTLIIVCIFILLCPLDGKYPQQSSFWQKYYIGVYWIRVAAYTVVAASLIVYLFKG